PGAGHQLVDVHAHAHEHVGLRRVLGDQDAGERLEAFEGPLLGEAVDADDLAGLEQSLIVIVQTERGAALAVDLDGEDGVDAQPVEHRRGRHRQARLVDVNDLVTEEHTRIRIGHGHTGYGTERNPRRPRRVRVIAGRAPNTYSPTSQRRRGLPIGARGTVSSLAAGAQVRGPAGGRQGRASGSPAARTGRMTDRREMSVPAVMFFSASRDAAFSAPTGPHANPRFTGGSGDEATVTADRPSAVRAARPACDRPGA